MVYIKRYNAIFKTQLIQYVVVNRYIFKYSDCVKKINLQLSKSSSCLKYLILRG